MQHFLSFISPRRRMGAIYLGSFIFSAHYVLVVYINSSFLATFAKESTVGLLYTAGSLITLAAFLLSARLWKYFSNYKILVALGVVEGSAILGLAFIHHFPTVALLFVIHQAIIPIIFLSFDLYLEGVTANKKTGSVRALFMTAINFTFAIAPLLVGAILSDHDFWKIYIVSAILIIPAIFVVIRYMNHFREPAYEYLDVRGSVRYFTRKRNLRNVFIASFLLQFFYAWMTIYTPIYLNNYIGFGWREIGVILSIMLLPFVIFEIPLGFLADRRYGEKEILIGGFVVMAVFTALLAFIRVKNVALWALLLFLTRVGASAVEIMTESYFFKQISDKDSDLIGVFRTTRPLAYIIAPPLAAVVFLFGSYALIFLVLGIIVLSGVVWSLKLVDTR